MKVNQLRAIASTLSATVRDRRKITALVTGIRSYSATVTTGTETSAIAKLREAITLATSYDADQAFLFMLRDQIKALKAKIKSREITVKFDKYAFQPPFNSNRGIATQNGIDYPFICYMQAPLLHNAARNIDPVFAASLHPGLKASLRKVVAVEVSKEWDRQRFAIIGSRTKLADCA